MTRLLLALPLEALPGRSLGARLAAARAASADAVTLAVHSASQDVAATAAALGAEGLPLAALALVLPHSLVDPAPSAREAAHNSVREAIALAADLGAPQVVFAPHMGPLALPDLMPFRDPVALADELLVWHLRGLCDLGLVFGVRLVLDLLHPLATGFLAHPAHGVALAARLKHNPHLALALGAFDLALTVPDPAAALREVAAHVGLVRLSARHGGLPGTAPADAADLAALLSALAQHPAPPVLAWVQQAAHVSWGRPPEVGAWRAALGLVRAAGV